MRHLLFAAVGLLGLVLASPAAADERFRDARRWQREAERDQRRQADWQRQQWERQRNFERDQQRRYERQLREVADRQRRFERDQQRQFERDQRQWSHGGPPAGFGGFPGAGHLVPSPVGSLGVIGQPAFYPPAPAQPFGFSIGGPRGGMLNFQFGNGPPGVSVFPGR